MRKLTILIILVIGSIFFLASCNRMEDFIQSSIVPILQSNEVKEISEKNKDEICVEHNVLESEDTRCDPSLIPEFKAKGDWCDEHNIPESQCTICNPELANKLLVSSESSEIAGLKVEETKFIPFRIEVKAPGVVTYNPKKLLNLTSRISGRIDEVFAYLHSSVKEGESIMKIYSPDFLSAQQELLQLKERLKMFNLLNENEERRITEALYKSAKQKLSILGLTENEINDLERNNAIQPYLFVKAPFAGTVSEINVIAGDYVQMGTNLLKLTNLSILWVIADIYETNIPKIKTGQSVEISTPIYPDKTFKGKIISLGDALDKNSRTLKAIIETSNPDLLLKPEMFVNVSILINNDSRLAVTREAILMDGEKKIVFVKSNDITYFRKEVETGEQTDVFVEILSGLQPGEYVVTNSNFLLKSDLFKSKLGAGCAE